jgi:hypothetical protein
MCEVGKSAYRGAEVLYPQPFGIIVYIPPLEKGGGGIRMNAYAFETSKIPLNPPLLKEDFKSSPKQASRCRIRMEEKKSMRSIHTNNKM